MAARPEDIIQCIEHRVGKDDMYKLRRKHGMDKVEDALWETGGFYAGVEEIGSSDISIYTNSFLRSLGE